MATLKTIGLLGRSAKVAAAGYSACMVASENTRNPSRETTAEIAIVEETAVAHASDVEISFRACRRRGRDVPRVAHASELGIWQADPQHQGAPCSLNCAALTPAVFAIVMLWCELCHTYRMWRTTLDQVRLCMQDTLALERNTCTTPAHDVRQSDWSTIKTMRTWYTTREMACGPRD